MGKQAMTVRAPDWPRQADAASILDALTSAVVTVDANNVIVHANSAGEQLFQGSVAHLRGRTLDEFLPGDSPLLALIDQARTGSAPVLEHGVTISSPRIGEHTVNVQAAPLAEEAGSVVLALHERAIAESLSRQFTHRGAVRSVSAMAAMLAHEVKNPLSGIRGAAQLLEAGVSSEDRALTRLIRDETDRICRLVDRMEEFSESAPLEHQPVNIHEVLDRVHHLAKSGFARHVRFTKNYDPSLPAVPGNRDQLVQVFLNLVKNAAEAAPERDAEIFLDTAYRRDVRVTIPGQGSHAHLPLVVAIRDNGGGIDSDMRTHLFNPFVTTKAKGGGLGLALVAKIVDDHGGAIEFDSVPGRTVFRILLPLRTDTDTH